MLRFWIWSEIPIIRRASSSIHKAYIGQPASPSGAPEHVFASIWIQSNLANWKFRLRDTHYIRSRARNTHIAYGDMECNMQFACTRNVRRAKRKKKERKNNNTITFIMERWSLIMHSAHDTACACHGESVHISTISAFSQALCIYACGKSHLTQSAKPETKRRIIWHGVRQLTSSVMPLPPPSPTDWLSTRPKQIDTYNLIV